MGEIPLNRKTETLIEYIDKFGSFRFLGLSKTDDPHVRGLAASIREKGGIHLELVTNEITWKGVRGKPKTIERSRISIPT